MRSPAVDNYIFDFPEETRLTMEVIRDIIFDLVPGVEEKIKWNCPFYSYNGLLCYINWDKKAKKVALGFTEGFLLEDVHGALNQGTSQVKKLFFDNPKEVDQEIISYYLQQAVAINQQKPKNFLNIKKGQQG